MFKINLAIYFKITDHWGLDSSFPCNFTMLKLVYLIDTTGVQKIFQGLGTAFH